MTQQSDREALADRLVHAITTMQNDDLSEPMSEKRDRHVERAETMRDVLEFLRSGSAGTAGIREATIEECAKLAEWTKPGFCGDDKDTALWDHADRIAKSIRALDNPPQGGE